MRRILPTLVLLSLPFCLCADEPDLSAERPGFTTPSTLVGLGELQLEQGYSLEFARLGTLKLRTFTAPQSTVRFGLSKSIELRFSSLGYSSQSLREGSGRNAISGLNDYSAGAKVQILQQTETRPEIAVIGTVSMPASGSRFTTGGHDPAFTVAANKDLPHKFSVIANANFASVTEIGRRNYSSGESIWLSRSTHSISPFVEVFHTTIAAHLGSEVVADAGFYRNLGRRMQIDVEMGHTVSGERPSAYASLGLVIRAPQALLGPERFRFRQS